MFKDNGTFEMQKAIWTCQGLSIALQAGDSMNCVLFLYFSAFLYFHLEEQRDIPDGIQWLKIFILTNSVNILL